MADSVRNPNRIAQGELADVRPAMQKATVRKPDTARIVVGVVLKRAGDLAGLTRLDQLAAVLQKDPRQVARWLSGEQAVQVDVVWAAAVLRLPLVQAFAEQLDQHGAEISTVITLRRLS